MNRLLHPLCLPIALGCVMLSTARGICADPPAGKQDPPKPLAELAKELRHQDLKKRYEAVVAIRDHYKGKSLEVLPQILAALGETLDQLRDEPTAEQSVLSQTEAVLRQVAYEAGSGRLKVIKECIRHPDPRVRAAAFHAWPMPANLAAKTEDRDDLLAAIRRGLKEESPLVRREAAFALVVFRDAPPKMAGEAVSLLTAALDDRAKPREGAFSPAFEAARMLAWFGAKAKPAIPALSKAVAAEDLRLAWMSITALHAIAKADESVAEEVVKVFRSVFTDQRRRESVREDAIRKLIGLGPTTRWAVPDLIDLLDDPESSAKLQWAAVGAFTDMGPRAAPAVPTLVKLLERSAARWELLQVGSALTHIALKAIRLDGRVVRVSPSRFAPRGRIVIGSHMLLGEVEWRVRGEQITVLRALQAIGPAAAPAVEPLKRYWDKVRGHSELEKWAYDALVAIEK